MIWDVMVPIAEPMATRIAGIVMESAPPTVVAPRCVVSKLCRLRYGGSAHTWGFASYRASYDDYEDTDSPTACSPAAQRKP
jgi:hypothetical protein